MHWHLIHQRGRIIFSFKRRTVFAVVVSSESERGGKSVLLEVTFTCTRMLENMAPFSTCPKPQQEKKNLEEEPELETTLCPFFFFKYYFNDI